MYALHVHDMEGSLLVLAHNNKHQKIHKQFTSKPSNKIACDDNCCATLHITPYPHALTYRGVWYCGPGVHSLGPGWDLNILYLHLLQ